MLTMVMFDEWVELSCSLGRGQKGLTQSREVWPAGMGVLNLNCNLALLLGRRTRSISVNDAPEDSASRTIWSNTCEAPHIARMGIPLESPVAVENGFQISPGLGNSITGTSHSAALLIIQLVALPANPKRRKSPRLLSRLSRCSSIQRKPGQRPPPAQTCVLRILPAAALAAARVPCRIS